MSKFDYTYDTGGNILTWRQQADTAAVLWEYAYDTADQLTAAIKKSTDPTPIVLKRYAYGYDLAGNRTREQVDDALTSTTYNTMNELVSQQPSGAHRRTRVMSTSNFSSFVRDRPNSSGCRCRRNCMQRHPGVSVSNWALSDDRR